jgi:hypothetical protein
VEKNDPVAWARIKTAQYESRIDSSTLDLSEPPFPSDDADSSDLPMDVLLEHIASGSVKIPVHCDLDINGMLSMSTLAESYELHEPLDVLPTATAGPDEDDDEQLEYGKGKRRRTANRQYDAFWSH